MASHAAIMCRVPGCREAVPDSDYHKRCKICLVHQSAPVTVIEGQNCRWCGLCKKFHAVEEFEDDKRNCIAALGRHNARRRQRRGGAAAADGEQPAGDRLHASSWDQADALPAVAGWDPAGMLPASGDGVQGTTPEPAIAPSLLQPANPLMAADIWGGHGPALANPTPADGSVLMPPLQYHEIAGSLPDVAATAPQAGPGAGIPHHGSPPHLQEQQQQQQQQQRGSTCTANSFSTPGNIDMNMNTATAPPPELFAGLDDMSLALSGLDLKDLPPIPSALSLEGLSAVLRSLANPGPQGGGPSPEVPPELANISLADLSMALGSLYLPVLPEDASMELCSMDDLAAVLEGSAGPAEPGPAEAAAAAAAAPPRQPQLAPGARLLLAELSARLPPEVRSLTLSELSLELGSVSSAQAREDVLALLGALGKQLPSLTSRTPLRSLEYLERRASKRHLLAPAPESYTGHPAEPQRAQQPLAPAAGGQAGGQETALPAGPAGPAEPAGACHVGSGGGSSAVRQPPGSQGAAVKEEAGTWGPQQGPAAAQSQGQGQAVRPHPAVNLRDFVQPPPPANFFLEKSG